jgi:hypothetical protein
VILSPLIFPDSTYEKELVAQNKMIFVNITLTLRQLKYKQNNRITAMTIELFQGLKGEVSLYH